MNKMLLKIKALFGEDKRKLKRAAAIVFVCVLLVFTVVVSATNFAKADSINRQTQDLEEECSLVQQDIAEKTALIAGEGFDYYCEKIAREKYGYAKPGENVIYDSSFGK